MAKRVPPVDVITGKGIGSAEQARALLLDGKDVRSLYHRVGKDLDNVRRVFVHVRWK